MATPPVLSKVHTFAQDLEAARARRGKKTPVTTTTAVTAAPTPTPTTATAVSSAPTQANTTTHTTPNTAATKNNSTPDTSTGPIKIASSGTRDASYPATIITDKKRNKFNLTSEMSAAIGDWWNEKIKNIKKSKKPTYSVPAVERRKGVVQTATTQTGRAATTDYSEVVAKLKTDPAPTLPTIPVSTPPAVIPLPNVPVPESLTWDTQSIALDEVIPDAAVAQVPAEPILPTATIAVSVPPKTPRNTDVILSTPAPTPVVPAPTRSNGVVVTSVVERAPRIVPTIPVSTPKKPPRPERKPMADPIILSQPRELETTITPPAPIVESPVAQSIPPPVTPISFPKINPVIPATPSVAPLPERRESAFAMLAEVPTPTLPVAPSHVKDTIAQRKAALADAPVPTPARFDGLLQLAPYLAGGAFVLITVGTIGYFVLSGTSSPTTETVTSESSNFPATSNEPGGTTPASTPAAVTTQLDAPNKTSLYTAIKKTAGLGEGLHIVTPLAHDTALPLLGREILSLISRQLNPAFLGNITSVQVGMYRDEPVLLLAVSDEQQARGGMYAWESTLSQDLSPWFGTPLRRTSTSTLTSFKDSTSAGRDVRLLTDDIGTERITYGFLNPYLILVTTNTTAFLNISNTYNSY